MTSLTSTPARNWASWDDTRRRRGGPVPRNKVALILLGTSGALSIYGPIQPLIGAASLALLGGTLAWRLRLRALGDVCPA